jgi:hypothetical protein
MTQNQLMRYGFKTNKPKTGQQQKLQLKPFMRYYCKTVDWLSVKDNKPAIKK